jgi:hypothetical protein
VRHVFRQPLHLAGVEIHAEQVKGGVFVRRFFLTGFAIRQKVNLVAIQIKRVLGEIQMDVVAGRGQLFDGTPCFFVLKLTDFRRPSIHAVSLSVVSCAA